MKTTKSALSQGLSRLPLVSDRRHRHTILQDAALASLRQGLPEAALYFEQAVGIPATEGDAVAAVGAVDRAERAGAGEVATCQCKRDDDR